MKFKKILLSCLMSTIFICCSFSAISVSAISNSSNGIPITTTVTKQSESLKTTISSVSSTENTTTTDEKEKIKGDISGNGKIDIYDAIEIAKSLLGIRTFTEEEKNTADFNNDGKVNLYDAIAIASYLLQNK